MERLTTKYSFLLSMLLLLSSCYYDNKEDLYIIIDGGNCDATDVSYSQTIRPLMDAQCISCHQQGNASGNVVLDSYNAVKQYADDGSLLGSVKHEAGYSAMPPGGNLSACSIQQLEAWIAAGSPEN